MPKPIRLGLVATGADLEAPSSALRLAAELRGNEAARLIQLGRVYAHQPPFDSSTLETAPAVMLEQARQSVRGIDQ